MSFMHSLAFILLPRDDDADARHGVDGRAWIATSKWATYDPDSSLPEEQRRFDYLSPGGRFMDMFLPDDYDPAADPANYLTCSRCDGAGRRPVPPKRSLFGLFRSRQAEQPEFRACESCRGAGKVADPKWLERFPPETARMTVEEFRTWIAKRGLSIAAWIRNDEAWLENWEMPGETGDERDAALRAIVEADLATANPDDWVIGLDFHMIYPDDHPVMIEARRQLKPGERMVEIAFG
ncbi:MAG: hypothetical protein VYB54_02475 [Pseudomonadota bacterium]|nr:hypothetical protein [Pseudomonadota bacterium]